MFQKSQAPSSADSAETVRDSSVSLAKDEKTETVETIANKGGSATTENEPESKLERFVERYGMNMNTISMLATCKWYY
jgi:hypothetical protein